MSCFATADKPPRYVQYEGSWIVGVHPPDPSKCVPLPFTLQQLQQQNCAKQGLQWNGQQCAPRPWYSNSWLWLLVLSIIFVVVLLLSTPTQQDRFMAYPLG
jgi:hypothetical protein